MNLEGYLKIGQLISIELTDVKGLTFRYPSRVENITEKELHLASPIKDRIAIYLPKGDEVKVFFWDCFTSYNFVSKVVCSINAQIPLVIIESPDELKRVQNREYVRVRYSIDVKITWNDSNGEAREKICRTRDISGGGMMLVLSKGITLEKGTTVKLDFEIENKFITTEAKVAWNDWEMDYDGILRNTLGIKFISLSEIERKHIVKSVYQRQIDLRRKGML